VQFNIVLGRQSRLLVVKQYLSLQVVHVSLLVQDIQFAMHGRHVLLYKWCWVVHWKHVSGVLHDTQCA